MVKTFYPIQTSFSILDYFCQSTTFDYNSSEYDFTYKNLKVYNTLSDVVVQNIAINKTEAKVMNPKQDLRIYDGILEKEKNVCLAVKDYITSLNEKIDTVVFDENKKKVILEVFELAKRNHLEFITSYNLFDELKFGKIPYENIIMLQTEVTQYLYEVVMGENPSYFKGDRKPPAEGELQEKRPVEYVSFYDAIYFCNKLSTMFGFVPVYSVDGETDITKWDYVPHRERLIRGKLEQDLNANGFRLPTGREWQNAAMGGYTGIKKIQEYPYAGSKKIEEVAWYSENSYNGTHEVGKKKANGYGLFDMCGNVCEWYWDFDYTGDVYFKGGSWKSMAQECTVYSRATRDPDNRYNYIGFRIVCSQE